MSIKTHVQEHFSQSPFSKHFNKHFPTKEIIIKQIGSGDSQVEIRKFTIQDIDECAELYKKVFNKSPWFDNWISTNQVRNYIEELVKNPVFEGFIAYENSNIITAVCFGHKKSWWIGKEFIIDEFYVNKDSQGNGLGSLLLKSIAKYLAEEDYKRLKLTTNKEIPAEKFYIKNGFYKNNKRIVMVKDI